MNEMKNYLNDFFTSFDYPQDASTELISAYDVITEKCHVLFDEIFMLYYSDRNCDYDKILKIAKKISEMTHIHEYTVKLLVFICLSKKLHELYSMSGISESIWFDSMCDLKYKLY